MKYTPGQVQEALRLSPGTFRAWKSVLPPLGGRNGYTPCFSPGDILAMAVIRTLAEDLGIRIGNLVEISVELFERCGEPWAALERSVLLIEMSNSRVTFTPDTQPIAIGALSIAIPMRSLIVGLRGRLLLEETERAQQPLRFPPTAVSGASGSGR